MASCFSCFTVKILKDFCAMAVARERSRLVQLKAIPTANPMPLANAEIDISPVITVDVMRPVSTIPVIVFNRFIFWQFLHEPQFQSENMLHMKIYLRQFV